MRRAPVWPLVGELVLVAAALLEGLATFEWATTQESVLAMTAAAGLVFRRRWPWLSLGLAIPAFALNLATLAGLAALFSIALGERRRWRLVATGAVVFTLTAVPWSGWISPNYAVLSFVYAALYAVAPIALGLLIRTRRELSERLQDLQDARQNEHTRIASHAVARERTRIAREMHDVVSHQVSLIAVQAGAIQVQTRDETTRQLAVTIRSLASRTLDELRDMVTLLRTEVGHSSLSPQPSIDDLERLIAESGVTVAADIALPADLSAPLQRAIYRTVQEGLTNARRHAPGMPVELVATSSPDHVAMTIRNARPVAPTSRSSSSPGHGLIGLRERAELLNGSVLTDSTPESFTLTFRAPR